MGHKANLDILRVFAVSAVLLEHLLGTLTAHAGLNIVYFNVGSAGVAAFFVHTCLVLMNSLERMYAMRTPGVPWRFYVRRFFRIYPLAIFCVVLAVSLHIPSSTSREGDPVTRNVVLANLLLVQNLWTKKEVLTPMWSLPYEIQMYFVLPALFLLASLRRSILYLAALFAGFCLMGAAVFVWKGHMNMFAYIPCFLAGVLCYTLRHRMRARIAAGWWMPFLVVISAAYTLANVYAGGSRPNAFIFIGWAFTLALGLAINAFKDCGTGWLDLAANKIALYSYGIYLLHIPALWLVFIVLGIHNIFFGTLLFVIVTLVASMATFHLLEGPAIELGRRLSKESKREFANDESSFAPVP